MKPLRLESVAGPLSGDPVATLAAGRLIARAQYLGVLPDSAEPREIGRPLLALVFKGLAEHGVARQAGLLLESADDAEDYRTLLDAALEQTEHSPMPRGEWPPLIDVLGEDLLVDLLSVSPSSLHRYVTGARVTPGDVAERLHVLALLVADLSGAYNEYGVRRWFLRKRTQLGGLSPRELLGPDFDPDGADAQRLRDLAAGLTAAGAT